MDTSWFLNCLHESPPLRGSPQLRGSPSQASSVSLFNLDCWVGALSVGTFCCFLFRQISVGTLFVVTLSALNLPLPWGGVVKNKKVLSQK